MTTRPRKPLSGGPDRLSLVSLFVLLGLGVVVATTGYRVGSIAVVVAFEVAALICWRNARRGRGPAFGRLIALTAGAWGLGHLLEVFTRVSPGWTSLFSPADVLFAVLLPGTVAVSLIVFTIETGSPTTSHGIDPIATARLTLDALLVSAALLTWHIVLVWAHAPDGTPAAATAYSLYFVGCLSLTFAGQLFAAVQAPDGARVWMAASTGVLTLAVSAWSLGIVTAPHTQRVGPTLLVAGLVLLVAASRSPAPGVNDDLQDGASHELVVPMLVAAGTWIGCAVPVLLHPRPASGALLVVTMLLMLARIIVVRSSARALTRRLRRYAYTDSLTGVGNRRSIESRIAGMSGWILSMDLDRFKEVNDRHGHAAGDELLARFAARVAALRPAGGHLARIGGDEFVLTLPGFGKHDARRVAHAVVHAGRDPRFPEVTVSVGVAPVAGVDSAGSALRNADIALRQAKARAVAGRPVMLDDEMLARWVRERAIARHLHENCLDGVRVVYQPVVSLTQPGRPVVLVEALARWHSDELGEIPPAEFVPIAERTGTIGLLGVRVLQEVITQLRVWHDAGLRLHVSVNVSWAQLRDETHVSQLAELLTRAQPLTRFIVLEATESLFATDDEAVAAAARLGRLGALIAIDDFGVGGSTLTRLRTLPVDVLKLDRALLTGVGSDPRADAVVRAVATLAGELGLTTIIEGVEDEDVSGRVQGLGMQCGQGYLYGRPALADDLARLRLGSIDLNARAPHESLPRRAPGPA